MNLKEKQLSRECMFKGKIITVYKDEALLPDGKTATREVIAHNGGVCVLPINENNEVFLVEQFRYPYNEVIEEIPAGKRDSLDEEPLATAKRELKEEIGATAKNYTFLGELYPTPGYCGEIIYMYLATDLSFGKACPDPDEFLNVKKYTFDEVIKKVLSGEIKDAKTQTAVLKAAQILKK